MATKVYSLRVAEYDAVCVAVCVAAWIAACGAVIRYNRHEHMIIEADIFKIQLATKCTMENEYGADFEKLLRQND